MRDLIAVARNDVVFGEAEGIAEPLDRCWRALIAKRVEHLGFGHPVVTDEGRVVGAEMPDVALGVAHGEVA